MFRCVNSGTSERDIRLHGDQHHPARHRGMEPAEDGNPRKREHDLERVPQEDETRPH